MNEYKIYNSPRKAWRLILPCILFIAGGIFMLKHAADSTWLSWTIIILFGLCLLIGLFQLIDKRPQIIINETGIFDRKAHANFINWEIINDAYIAELFEKEFICLVIDDTFKGLKKKGISKIEGFQAYNISLGNVKIDAERLLDFILKMRFAEKSTRTNLIKLLAQH